MKKYQSSLFKMEVEEREIEEGGGRTNCFYSFSFLYEKKKKNYKSPINILDPKLTFQISAFFVVVM